MQFIETTILSDNDLFSLFKTRLDGLTTNEVTPLVHKYGRNELKTNEIQWWHLLLRQFKSAFIYLLLFAGILAWVLGEPLDAGMIFLFISINAVLGFYQEFRSEQTLKLLKEYVQHHARVRRNGKEMMIDSRDLVPGDIVILEAGDLAPADLRLFNTHQLIINESILTGESSEVHKISQPLDKNPTGLYEAKNIVFTGTSVMSGRGEGVVFATGRETQIGTITSLTVETQRESSFEKSINEFSQFILRLVLVTLVVVFLIHLFVKQNQTGVGELVIFSIALAVGVIPEGLPLVTTFSLSRGALHLSKKKVVVKRLSAIEDLGSIEVLCSDKTGTLTENKLTVVDINSSDPSEAILIGAIGASELSKQKTPNNSFDLALFEKLTPAQHDEVFAFKRLNEVPFDPERKRNSVLVEKDNQLSLIVRGAVEVVLPFCSNLNHDERSRLSNWIEEQGEQGHRLIAVAKKNLSAETEYTTESEEGQLTFVGLISFSDPIKESTVEAVRKAEALGVVIKIITGDSKEVAGAVAHDVGIITNPRAVITGVELEQLPYEQQQQAVEKYNVFARVSPEQKYRIIQLLQQKYAVGFLGEGINDAPALKIANVALVVKGAADIAQEASDIVLLQNNLSVIVNGIEEGRRTFVNTVKYIKATLAS